MYEQVDMATLNARLYGLLWTAMELSKATIKIQERLAQHRIPPEPVDRAFVIDRLHEVCNAYSFLTRSTLWQDDIEDELH